MEWRTQHPRISSKLQHSFRSVMNVAVDEAQLISILLKIMNAKKTLEIGVFTGYSLLATALIALPSDGKVIAIDVDKEAYETGMPFNFIEKAGVKHKFDFIHADALSALTHLIHLSLSLIILYIIPLHSYPI